MTDFFAQRNIHGTVTNIGELLRNSDKLFAMRLLGCEKKYTDGSCSDYEFFAEWERVLPLCAGTGVCAVYGEEQKLLGLSAGDPLIDAWRKGNDRLADGRVNFWEKTCLLSIYSLNKFVSNYVRKHENVNSLYEDIRKEWQEYLCAEKSKSVHIVVLLDSLKFQKPNPYSASMIWRKNHVEKWNQEEESVFLTQLLIDGLLTLKKYKKEPVLHLYAGEIEVADATVDYLLEHDLIDGQIRLGVSSHSDPEHLVMRMEKWSGKRVTPALVLPTAELDEGLEERLFRLFCTYPAGGLRFGGILTDAPLIEAYHASFDRRFRVALTRLGATPSAAEQIARAFYSVIQ